MKDPFDSKVSYYFILLLICIQFLTWKVIAQTPEHTVKFSYDLNGNRVLRWLDVKKIAIADTVDSLDQDSLIKKNHTNSHILSGTISIFPNPTEGLLDMKITGMKTGETAESIFFSLTGQELLRKKTDSPISQIDISTFPPGTYIVNVKLGNQVAAWKIVKQ